MNPLRHSLQVAIRSSRRQLREEDILKAWDFADLAHTAQNRLTGEPFIHHPTAVAVTLIHWGLDTACIQAGLLHDTVEDGGATREDLLAQFGPEVAQIVEGVTKITEIRLTGSTQNLFTENLRKMLLVMAKDLRVILVKLADRLHNMQTLSALPPEKQVENARETLEIYAPLAERLGIGHIKGQLEDLAFPYVYPKEYEDLIQRTQKLFKEGEKYMLTVKRELLLLLIPQIPGVVVSTRHKHLYSLFKKLQRPEIDNDLGKIFDIAAARVITDRPEQCYLALGAIHSKYRPVPNLGISDYIANPKPNGYQSLHTKVFGPHGNILEIQIRTHAMHEQAELGIAAHWQYGEAKAKGASDAQLEQGGVIVPKKLAWVKELVAWQKEMADDREYLQALKFDALHDRILVFSPIGDVYDLPRGATPVDFAYAVHSGLGNQTKGAKVNGRLVALDYQLQNGDMVEILIDRSRTKPNPDWSEFVVTTAARRAIAKKAEI